VARGTLADSFKVAGALFCAEIMLKLGTGTFLLHPPPKFGASKQRVAINALTH
jgi:hypothetical protein